MRPVDADDSDFVHNGLGRSFTFEPADGPLSDWRIAGSYDDRLTITELHISPRTPPTPQNGVTGALLRQISPAALTDRIRSREQGWRSFLEEVRQKDDDETLDPAYLQMRDKQIEHAEGLVSAPRSGPTRIKGRPPLDADFLRDVVREHIEEIELDTNYGAIQRLAHNRGVSKNTAKDWIAKARARGLYPGWGKREE
jgi:hypothetical protein